MQLARLLQLTLLTALIIFAPACERAAVDSHAESSLPAPAQSVLLKCKFSPGDVHALKITMDQDVNQEIMGQKQDMHQVVNMGMRMTVDEVRPDGAAVIRCVYESVAFKQDGPLGHIEYDSAAPPEFVHPMAQAFKVLLNKEISFTVTPAWETLEINGYDEILEDMQRELGLPDAIMAQMKEQFGENSMKNILEQVAIPFPDKPLAVGDSWSKRSKTEAILPVIMDNEWTVKKIQSDAVVLDVKTKVSPNEDAAPMQLGVASISYQLSGDQTGSLTIDPQTGWPIASEAIQNFSGHISINATGADDDAQSWPMTIKSRVTIESY